MAEDFTQQIEARLAELPQDVQEAILSNEWEQKVAAIAKAHNLHIDQTEKLGSETLLLMLGFTEAQNFISNIAEEVAVSREDSEKLAAEINTQVMLSIRESLKNSPTQPPTAPTTDTEKSVVMPSSINAAPKPPTAPAAVAPTNVPSAPPAVPAVAITTMPIKPPEMHPAEVMLTEKTVQVAPPTPATKPEAPKPAGYKADPYREPPE